MSLIDRLTGRAALRRRAEAAERRYRTLVEGLPAAHYVRTLEGGLEEFAGAAIVELLGYDLDEWHRNPQLLAEIVHPVDQGILATATAGDRYDVEYRVFHRSGEIMWVRDRGRLAFGPDGGPIDWHGFMVDVTDKKEADARFRALAEQLPLITYIDDPYSTDEAASYVSPQVEDVLGYTLEEWHADPSFFVNHLHPEDRERVRDSQRIARETGQTLEIEYRVIAKDGRTVWLQDGYTVVRDETGRPLYTQGYALDITERKEAEAELQLQNERLRELDRMKDEFVALVSHELRTPLTSIRGYLELLLDDAEEIEAVHRDWLSVIDRNSERLLALVEDLLLKAQVNAGKIALTLADADLAAIVEQSVRAAAPAAAARDLELTSSIETLPPAAVDAVRVGQVVDNLVSNALKFTPAGGSVDVRAFARDSRIRVEVADTGPGISADEQQRLFERFFRTTQAQTDAVPGVGLGLSIAKAIIEAHGGTITCTSEAGAGATFALELPARSAVAA
jgi:PAS domain S-box-containing protein